MKLLKKFKLFFPKVKNNVCNCLEVTKKISFESYTFKNIQGKLKTEYSICTKCGQESVRHEQILSNEKRIRQFKRNIEKYINKRATIKNTALNKVRKIVLSKNSISFDKDDVEQVIRDLENELTSTRNIYKNLIKF